MSSTPAPLPPPVGPPAGWYPDPSGRGVRYFDGIAWAPGPAFVPADERAPYPTLHWSVGWLAVLILAVSLVVEKLAGEVTADHDVPIFLDAGLSLVLAYGPSLWWCRRVARRAGGWRQLGWAWHRFDAGWGPLTFAGALIAQVLVVSIAIELGIPFTSNVEVTDGNRTVPYVIAMILSACVAAPLVEEVLFRGVVLRGFAGHMHVVAAVAVQGALFGCAHIDPSRGWGNIGLALGLTSTGCALGLVAVLTRRLGAPIVAHALLNGLVVILLLTGVTDDLRRDLDAVAGALVALVS